MEPYYSDGLVTLWHGDCAEVRIGVRATILFTDPPYNVGVQYDGHDDRMEEATYLAWLRERFAVLSRDAMTAGPIMWFWQGSRLANGEVLEVLPPGYVVHHVGAWFKREFAGDLWKSSHPAYSWEPIIWARHVGSEPSYAGPRGGHDGRDALIGNSPRHDGQGGPDGHPAPKPLSVVSGALGWVAGPQDVVLDPFAGSGTTLFAAKRRGLHSIGVEQSERYCEQIARRLSQEVLGLPA